MQAIETSYKGYRFRSRLEARWAVAFDAMGWAWEYEPEGFELGDGTRYLPDFKVFGRLWLEVKPPTDVARAIARVKSWQHSIMDEWGDAWKQAPVPIDWCSLPFLAKPTSFAHDGGQIAIFGGIGEPMLTLRLAAWPLACCGDETCPALASSKQVVASIWRPPARHQQAFASARSARFGT